MKNNITKAELAAMIDHTNLKATACRGDIEKLCKEALEYRFASVCINPVYVPLAASLLQGSGVAVCTVAGFPLGASAHENKAAEGGLAVKQGAQEVDMVIDIGAVKDGRWDDVESDIAAVVAACKPAAVKVIFEICYLSDEQIAEACKRAVRAGAAFVKTSTGFGSSGATPEAVALMRKTVGTHTGIKAAGGIRTAADALKMIEAGANRLGCSASIEIVSAWLP